MSALGELVGADGLRAFGDALTDHAKPCLVEGGAKPVQIDFADYLHLITDLERRGAIETNLNAAGRVLYVDRRPGEHHRAANRRDRRLKRGQVLQRVHWLGRKGQGLVARQGRVAERR